MRWNSENIPFCLRCASCLPASEIHSVRISGDLSRLCGRTLSCINYRVL